MPLFEVAIIHEATKKKEEEIVYYPVAVIAEDEKKAALVLILDLDKDIKKELDPKRARVLVRPF